MINRTVNSFFSYSGHFRWWKLIVKTMQSRPWRFRGSQVNIYHVVIYSSWLCTSLSNVLLSARTCLQSVSAIYIYILIDYEISFSLCKLILGNISEKATTEFSQFAFSHGRCKSTHQLIVRFFSTNPSLSNRWVVSNTLISITYMSSWSLNVLHTD